MIPVPMAVTVASAALVVGLMVGGVFGFRAAILYVRGRIARIKATCDPMRDFAAPAMPRTLDAWQQHVTARWN